MVSLVKKPIVWILILVAVLCIGLGISCARVFTVDAICPGVKAGDISVSNLSLEEAEAKLRDNLSTVKFDAPLHIVFGDVEKTVLPSDFLVAYDYKKTAEKALSYAHEGNFFQKVSQSVRAFFFKKEIPMEISYDEAVFETTMENLMSGIGEKVQEHSWVIEEDTLIFTNGHPGYMPDSVTVSEAILEALRNGTYNKKIVFKKDERNPRDISVDTLYDAVYAVSSDASYKIEDGKVVMTPHVFGVSFDKEQAKQLMDENTKHGQSFRLPLQISAPSVTTEDIEAKLFSKVIGEHTTTFKTSDVGRSKNIALATHKINGTILAPGEIFSYNDVVGERSYSEGFQTAHVYVNGETVDGIGGGICQVSSTLFNAVVFANLDIVERVNHQLTVSYVPLGRDATVDYGNIDFRFKNTTGNPVKIVGTCEDGTLHMALLGFKEHDNETVTFETVTVGHTDPPERKVDDPTLPLGEEKEESPGSIGYIVDTYKVIHRDGMPDEKIYLCRSNYRGTFRIIHVGTGEAVPENPLEEVDPNAPGAEPDTPSPSDEPSSQKPEDPSLTEPTASPEAPATSSPEPQNPETSPVPVPDEDSEL